MREERASVFRHVRRAISTVTKSKGAPEDALLAATQRRDVSRFRVCRGLLAKMLRALAALVGVDELDRDRLVVVAELTDVDREQTRGILGYLDLHAIHPEHALRLTEIGHPDALQDLDVALAVDPTGEHLEPPASETVTRAAYASLVTKSRRIAWT